MMTRLRSLWRNLMYGDRVDRDIADEVRWTFETLIEEKMRAGMTEREARRAVNMELGHAGSIAAEVRDVRQGAAWSAFRQDVRYALRRLVRTPRFTIVAIVTLACAVGANAADLGLLERVTTDVGREAMKEVEGGLPNFAPSLRYHAVADSSLRFTVTLSAREYRDQALIRHEFLKRLRTRYEAAGLLPVTAPSVART